MPMERRDEGGRPEKNANLMRRRASEWAALYCCIPTLNPCGLTGEQVGDKIKTAQL